MKVCFPQVPAWVIMPWPVLSSVTLLHSFMAQFFFQSLHAIWLSCWKEQECSETVKVMNPDCASFWWLLNSAQCLKQPPRVPLSLKSASNWKAAWSGWHTMFPAASKHLLSFQLVLQAIESLNWHHARWHA